MSDEYTPTTDEIRNGYWAFGRNEAAAFDRWLAAHDADLTARLERAEQAVANVESWFNQYNGTEMDVFGWYRLETVLDAYRPVAAHPTTESEKN